MPDDFPKASTHLLVISKRHIKNTKHLKPNESDLRLIEKMQEKGEETMKQIAPMSDKQ